MRKVVQIAILNGTDGNEEVGGWTPSIFALCNDGTLWRFYLDEQRGNMWEYFEPIPQDEEHGLG